MDRDALAFVIFVGIICFTILSLVWILTRGREGRMKVVLMPSGRTFEVPDEVADELEANRTQLAKFAAPAADAPASPGKGGKS
jgi:hypothetical protein